MAAKSKSKDRTFAITLSIDTAKLKKLYPGPSWRNGYQDIERVLKSNGFTRQGRLYVGEPGGTAPECVSAVLSLSQRFRWFSGSVKDIRMLKIEVAADLIPVLNAADL